MRPIDADALISALCLEDGEPQQYCFPCKKMFSAIRSAPTIPELTSEEIRELSSWSFGPFHKKIADWLQAESEGCLVMLPCKVGDTVWFIASRKVRSGICHKISIHAGGMQITINVKDDDPWTVPPKKVIKTRVEAEADLKGVIEVE